MKDRINLARIVCVLGMIYVHVPDGNPVKPLYGFHDGNLGLFFEGLLVEGPGRASAALLSLLSGYLAAVALLKSGGDAIPLYRRRFRSIILPMVFWSCLTYLVYYVVSHSRPTFISEAETWLDTINIIFFLTEMPLGATMHLGFLRDLFVCILLSPILIMALRRFPVLLLVILGLFYLLEHEQSAVIILRPLVIFAFTLGLLLAIKKVRLDALDQYFPLFAGSAVLLTAMLMLVNGGAAAGWVSLFSENGFDFRESVMYPLVRLFASLAIWTFLPLMMGGVLQRLGLRLLPYLFAAFCSHYLMLTVVFFAFWSPLFGSREGFLFPVWFFVAPLLSMLIAWLTVKIALAIAPPLATVITGGRIKTSIEKKRRMAIPVSVSGEAAELRGQPTKPWRTSGIR